MYARLFAVASLPLFFVFFPALTVPCSGSTAGDATLKQGKYKGEAQEMAQGVAYKGMISIIIPRIKTGKVDRVEVIWSGGLIGMGALSGTLDKAGNLRLEGTVTDSTYTQQWDVTLTAKVKHHAITGQYGYRGRNGAINGSGEFKAELVVQK